jgi:serine/threonine protein kinase
MGGSGADGRLQPGSDFGSFRVLELLGIGGMGEVYLVKRAHLDRPDALKVLNQNADGATATRFLREMELAARLQHPHVVAVHDVGQVETVSPVDGSVVRQPWILMQYVAGTSLRQHLQAAAPLPLPVERTLGLLTQVADGLDAAHRLGIVHRDVKPENVLVYSDPSGRQHAYVADLGIAEALDAANRLTGTSGNLGTPGYMSPERFFGSSELDARADVYALGCMAFEMLSMKLPRDVSPGFSELPSLSRTRPGYGDDADAVLRKALALRPEDRYRSCPDLVAALATALRAGATTDLPPSRPSPSETVRLAASATPPAAPAALPAGATTTAGEGPGDSRKTLLLVGGGLALAAVGVVAALQLGGSNGTPRGARTTPGTSPTPTPVRPTGGVSSSVTWSDATTPTEDQRAVLAQLPSFFADTGRCGNPPAVDRRSIVPVAQGNVVCTYPGGTIAVFSLFDSEQTMQRFFLERLDGRRLRAGQGTPGPRAPWVLDYEGDPERGAGRIYGNVSRDRPRDPVRSEVGWIRKDYRMYGYAFRPNADFAGFYTWWAGLFKGPLPT